MSAGPITEYASAGFGIVNGQINLTSGTFVMVMLSSAYSPSFAADAAWASVSANEIASGGGYTQGGAVLGSFSGSVSNGVLAFSCGNPSWSAFTATFKYGVIVQRAGSSLAPSDLLLCAFDADAGGGSVTGNGSSLVIQFSSGGVLAYSLAGQGDTYVTNLASAGTIAANAEIAISQGGSDFNAPLTAAAPWQGPPVTAVDPSLTAAGGTIAVASSLPAMIPAAGSNQATAAPLTAPLTIFTSVSLNEGGVLPLLTGVPMSRRVACRGSVAVTVWPGLTQGIENNATNVPVTIAPGGDAEFIANSGSRWSML